MAVLQNLKNGFSYDMGDGEKNTVKMAVSQMKRVRMNEPVEKLWMGSAPQGVWWEARNYTSIRGN
jgi:hypothetical protein